MAKAEVDGSFTGFPPAAFTFFKRLAKNNRREWFLDQKLTFEQNCQAPLKALTQVLDPPFGASRITRIYRDIRFSKDKSPYRTHISTAVRGTYLSLSAEGLWVGTGLYMPDPAVLRRFRDAIGDERSGRLLATLVASLLRRGYEVSSHEMVTSAPRGFRADHPRVELLRMKDIYAGTSIVPAQLGSTAAVKAVRKVSADVAPLREWLHRYVGKSGA